ncbi:MAG: hypothetical protein V4587_02140 [Acidobacteriota bacterium]
MRVIQYFAIVSVVAGLTFFAPSSAKAQVSLSFGVNVGPQPVCPYGYFDYPPYNCAPYGYYGPEWFPSGFFIGAGPWFHGRHGWHGHVDDRYDPRHGYHGEFPHHGERADHFRGYGHGHEFRGNSVSGGYENHGGDHGDHGYHGDDHGDHGNHGYHGDHGDHGYHGDHH